MSPLCLASQPLRDGLLPSMTPDYELAEMFGTSKVTIDPRGHGNPVTYLIRQGYLADPEFVPVEITTQVQISQPREGFDYTSSDLRTLGDDSAWQASDCRCDPICAQDQSACSGVLPVGK